MNIIRKHPVTLSPKDCELLCGILSDYARSLWAHANRTKSAAIAESCRGRASQMQILEAEMVRSLYAPQEQEN